MWDGLFIFKPRKLRTTWSSFHGDKGRISNLSAIMIPNQYNKNTNVYKTAERLNTQPDKLTKHYLNSLNETNPGF